MPKQISVANNKSKMAALATTVSSTWVPVQGVQHHYTDSSQICVCSRVSKPTSQLELPVSSFGWPFPVWATPITGNFGVADDTPGGGGVDQRPPTGEGMAKRKPTVSVSNLEMKTAP